MRLKDHLNYDPQQDILTTVAAIAALDRTEGPGLAAMTKLPPDRLNRAMDYVQDYGLAEVINFLGTAPYNFGHVIATRHTRKFAEEHSR